MISSLILRTATRYLFPLILLFALFALFRGHNEPGGGFVGGLLAASAFILQIFAFGINRARISLGFEPISIIGTGLALAVGSALISPILTGSPFMTAVWGEIEIPSVGKLSTPLMFDAGVMLVVVGVVLLIIFTLAQEDDQLQFESQTSADDEGSGREPRRRLRRSRQR